MRFIVALILVLLVPISKAEHNGIPFDEKDFPMLCGDTEHILQGLEERFSEEVTMLAPSKNEVGHDLVHSLWINVDTNTWTFTVMNMQLGVSCVLASGDNLKMFFPGTNGI